MKIVYILFSLLFISIVVIQLFAMSSQKDIETYPYEVIKKMDGWEIRKYEARLFTKVRLPGNEYKKMSNKGFSMLAGYIFGKNEKEEKIAMTSPVAMTLEDSMTMMFMVPKQYTKETLPRPDEDQIEFQEEPSKIVAATTFGGWANDKKIEKHKQKLVAALKSQGIEHTGRFYFLGYNAPYEVFNRRNEIIVELPENVIEDL